MRHPTVFALLCVPPTFYFICQSINESIYQSHMKNEWNMHLLFNQFIAIIDPRWDWPRRLSMRRIQGMDSRRTI